MAMRIEISQHLGKLREGSYPAIRTRNVEAHSLRRAGHAHYQRLTDLQMKVANPRRGDFLRWSGGGSTLLSAYART